MSCQTNCECSGIFFNSAVRFFSSSVALRPSKALTLRGNGLDFVMAVYLVDEKKECRCQTHRLFFQPFDPRAGALTLNKLTFVVPSLWKTLIDRFVSRTVVWQTACWSQFSWSVDSAHLRTAADVPSPLLIFMKIIPRLPVHRWVCLHQWLWSTFIYLLRRRFNLGYHCSTSTFF